MMLTIHRIKELIQPICQKHPGGHPSERWMVGNARAFHSHAAAAGFFRKHVEKAAVPENCRRSISRGCEGQAEAPAGAASA